MPSTAEVTTGRLESLLRGLTHREPIAQAVVAVESGNRSFRWVGTQGETGSGDRVVENTPFFIASIDKLYNATIAMSLSEAGRLDQVGSISANNDTMIGDIIAEAMEKVGKDGTTIVEGAGNTPTSRGA